MTFDDAEDFAPNDVEHSLPFCARDCTQTTSLPITGVVATGLLGVPPNLQELFRPLEGGLIGNGGRSESGITAGHDDWTGVTAGHDWTEYRRYSGVDGGDQGARSPQDIFYRPRVKPSERIRKAKAALELRLVNPVP